MARFQLFLFGTPRLARDRQPIQIRRRKGLALLAYLALTGRPHSREGLATLLWPELSHSRALSNLRRELSRLKRDTAAGLFLADRKQLALNPEGALWVDVEQFRSLLARVAEHDHFPEEACDECLEALVEATELYAEDFLAGFTLPDAAAFDEWHFFEGESLRRGLAEALQQLIAWHGDRAEFGDAIPYARRWLALDPLHEPAHQALMTLYAREGQQAAALRQYDECVRLLEEELGVEPDPATTELYEAIRTRQFPPEQPAEAAVAELLAPAPPPAGRYALEEQLAVGGQGELFRGRDRQSGESVIVKRLRPELVADAERVARFRREGELLRRLNHPNIVRILDFFEEAGQQHIVMEELPGGTLRARMEEDGAFPVEKALAIALELADALARAHHLGIIHRDLKPENVLLAGDGSPRLTDFGLAGMLAADARLTQTGAILGSPAYMSPEALRGEQLAPESDVWSFGVMLFELLAGRRPFAGQQISQVLLDILSKPAPQLATLQPELPPALVALVEKTLVKERSGRIGSMRQVASALEAIQAGQTPVALGPAALPESTSLAPAQAPAPAGPTPALPVQPTAFVGRRQELESLLALLAGPDARLVTITGIGGVGKTRLALAAAERLATADPPPLGDGVVFVPLAPLSTPAEIVPAVAAALGLALHGEGDQTRRQLLDYLGEKELLLLLDNAEHLLGEAGLPLAAEILAAAPAVRLLVTSRTRLNVRGEQLFPLEGLNLAEMEAGDAAASDREGKTSEAVRLFLERARQIRPDFSIGAAEAPALARICRLVEGLPLGIELAAAWLDVLPLEEIAAEIERSLDFLETGARDVPARQRSLRAVFAGSWQLLGAEEQAAVKALSVFQGSAGREAAQAVAGVSLRTLRALAEKSWIQRSGNRYQMHDLLRQYGREKLAAEPEAEREARARHAAYYAGLLQQQAAAMRGPAQADAFAAVGTAFVNLRAAWHFLLAQGEIETLVTQMLPGLHHYCEARSRGNEIRRLVEAGLEAAAGAGDQARSALLTVRGAFYRDGYPVRLQSFGMISPEDADAVREAWSLRGGVQVAAPAFWDPLLAYLYGRIVNRQQGIYQLRRFLAHFRRQGQRWEIAICLHHLAQLLQLQLADVDEPVADLLAEALAHFQALGDARESGYTMRALGQQHRLQQELEAALGQWEAAQKSLEEIGEWAVAADIHWQMGDALLQLGRFEEAFVHYRQMSDTYLAKGQRDRAGRVLSKESYEMTRYGDPARARRARAEALALARQAEDAFGEAWDLWEMGELERVAGNLDAARHWFERAAQLFGQIEDETGFTFYHRGLGDIALAQGAYLDAQQQFQESLRHAQATDHQWALAYAWHGMGQASLGLNHVEMAQHHFLEGLRRAEATGDRGIMLLLLSGVTAFFLAIGNTVRAVALGTFVGDHPLTWREIRARVQALLASAGELPDARLAEARAWAKGRALSETVAELLEELAGTGRETAAGASRLPVPATPFVGRDTELAELRRLLLGERNSRLLTLTGPGGIGKTRLALEAAAQSRLAFRDGAYFVPLAPLSSTGQIGAALAAAVGFHFGGAAEPERQLLHFLENKEMLLVLDNFEHVVEGATLVAEILAAAPGVRLIVTSREGLQVSGETVYPVQGLSVPAGEALVAADVGRYDALELFLQHARRIRPGFAPDDAGLRHAARIVRLVEGTPLALMMAAGWLDILSLSEIAAEIGNNLDFLESTARDLPPRQRSMRAAFAYSWQRLPAPEQQVFMKLSVFQGGFNRDAAEAIAGAGLRTLRTLANKSFLSMGEGGRFAIHELLRQFGLEQLATTGERARVEEAHSSFFLGALRQREEDMKGRRQLEALDEVEADLENVRAAWQWAIENEREDLLSSGCRGLHLFFHITGRYNEAVPLFHRPWRRFRPETGATPRPVWKRLVPCLVYNAAYIGAATPEMKEDLAFCLELAEAEEEPFQRAASLLALGCYALFAEQDTKRAIDLMRCSLDLFRDLEEAFSVALALAWLGFAHGQNGEPALFRDLSEESVAVGLAAGNRAVAAAAKHNVGFVTITAGDYEAAEGHCRQALEMAEEMGRWQTIAVAQLHLGLLRFLQGEFEQAREWAEKGLQIAERINVDFTRSYGYSLLSLCATVSGDSARAQGLSEKSRLLTAPYYYRLLSNWARALSCAVTEDATAWEFLQAALEQAETAQFPAPVTWLLPVAALLLAHSGRAEKAAELLALAFHHPQSARGWIEQWPRIEALREELAQALGEECYRQAWRRGEQLELEVAVAAMRGSSEMERS